MPISDPALWAAIRDWPLPFLQERDRKAEPPRICRSFEDYLRKEGDWTDDSARRIVAAYRQFLYLKALTGETLTPSMAIEGAWDLHLGFPKDYAALCAAVGRSIPQRTHLETPRREAEAHRASALYRQEFDTAPLPDLWLDSAVLRQERIGKAVGVAGFVAFVLGGLSLLWTRGELVPLNAILLGGGFVAFLVGGAIAGQTKPARMQPRE